MMKTMGQKMMALLLTVCLAFGLCANAFAQPEMSADFEALMPLMDLVCAASHLSPNAPEHVPGADETLSSTFVDAFLCAGLALVPEMGITDQMLNDPAAQKELLGSLFAAQLPELKAVPRTEYAGYIGFHPVTINNGVGDGNVQIIGEMYQAERPMRAMEAADYASVSWIDRAVFTFAFDSSALNGFRLTGFSVGTDLTYEQAMQGYFEEIAVEYESKLGFMLLYPAVFEDELLEEDENGISASLPDGSASFSARRMDNENSATLAEYVSVIANGITGSVSTVYEEMQYGTVRYTTEDGYTVFDVFILTDLYIFQAELTYLTEQSSVYSMYDAYLENSFVVNELSQG